MSSKHMEGPESYQFLAGNKKWAELLTEEARNGTKG